MTAPHATGSDELLAAGECGTALHDDRVRKAYVADPDGAKKRPGSRTDDDGQSNGEEPSTDKWRPADKGQPTREEQRVDREQRAGDGDRSTTEIQR